MKATILRSLAVTALCFATADALAQRPGDAVAFPAAGEPQVIHLDNGTKLTFLGLTTGTQQMAPGFENLPTANRLYTPDCPTMAWIKVEHDHGGNWTGSLELLVSDKARTACVDVEKSTSSHVRSGEDVQGFILRAFPRWDNEFLARVKLYRGAVSKEEFVISNPAPVTVTNWTPEPLPITKSAGDLEVTLIKLVAGAPNPFFQGEHPLANDPANQCVHLNFDFRQNGLPATNWYPWPVLTCDAAGNRARGLIRDYPKNGMNPIYPDRIHPSFPPSLEGYYYQPGLWPDHPPWKVKLEFIRWSNFSDEETATFTNLSVRPGTKHDADDEWSWEPGNTNFAFVAEQMVNGVKLKLLTPLLLADPDQIEQKRISVLIFGDPERQLRAMNLTLLQATDENGQEVATPFRNGGGWAGHYGLDFPNVHEVKMLNLKLALHRSRFVEFTVTPSKP